MINVLGLVACASSSPEPESATQNTLQTQPEQTSPEINADILNDSNTTPTEINHADTNIPNAAQPDIEQIAESPIHDAQSDSPPDQPSTQTPDAVTSDHIVTSDIDTDPQSNSVSSENTITEPVDYAAKRKTALAALRNGDTNDATDFWNAIDSDPLMTATLYDEVKPRGTNALSALGGGSTVSLKYTDSNDETLKAAIKPDQDLRQTMYRSEIAYYRLCQILECSYDVPVTRPVKFSHDDFYQLYAASNSKKNKNYRSKFEHLIWEKEYGSKFIYAAHKEWIASFEFFPIEVTGEWSPYLKNPNTNPPEIDKFIRNLLASARPDAPKSSKKLLQFLEGKTTRDILHQISDMILIDYLTNNWDRFSGSVNNYGANCHIQPGGLIAIDNGAAFPPWHAPRVVRRLHMVETFSRTLVTNLRLINVDELLIRLFPNPTHEERKSFDRFRERHADALKYIDKLIAKKGEENVLVFD